MYTYRTAKTQELRTTYTERNKHEHTKNTHDIENHASA